MTIAVLLDLDDTLTDRVASFERWATAFLLRVGRDMEDLCLLVELDRRGVRPRPEFLELVNSKLDLDLNLDNELLTYRAATSTPPLQSGVVDQLRRIRASGGRIGVLTNGVARAQRGKLAATGLYDLVDDVVISEEVGLNKPDPAIFALAVKRLGVVDPQDAWMVGDSVEKDIEGAIEAGLKTAWVNRGNEVWPTSRRPDIERRTTAECLDDIIG